ncbi:MAG: FAD-dependent oxidoreductase [Gemmatimonadaceae bacterium]|nr:FAD-dependent oxidoreductase [Gemmatimonadaceae bacterium]
MRRLVLLGGGHAHLEVLRQAARRRFDGGEILVISPSAHSHYTGMIPGFIRGRYSEGALAFDIAALARAAGAVFCEGRAAEVAADGRSVTLEGGELVACDLVSADVGSVPAGRDSVSGVREFTFGARPIARARALVSTLNAALQDARERGSDAASACVVGGGAGGVEIVLAMRARAEHHGVRLPLALIDGGQELLSEFEPGMRQRAARVLAAREIDVRTGADVTAVERTHVVLADGSRIASTMTVWLTGAAPAKVTELSALPRDPAGFWQVDGTLRSTGGAPVWGAGDCVSLLDHPWVPKAGVYAVRQAPVLAVNLRAALERGATAATRVYSPQRKYLALLDTADGRALMRWRGQVLHGRAPLWLKHFIDARFVRRYATRA